MDVCKIFLMISNPWSSYLCFTCYLMFASSNSSKTLTLMPHPLKIRRYVFRRPQLLTVICIWPLIIIVLKLFFSRNNAICSSSYCDILSRRFRINEWVKNSRRPSTCRFGPSPNIRIYPIVYRCFRSYTFSHSHTLP